MDVLDDESWMNPLYQKMLQMVAGLVYPASDHACFPQ